MIPLRHPPGQRLLQKVGLLRPLRRRGQAPADAELHRPGKPRFPVLPAVARNHFPPGIVIDLAPAAVPEVIQRQPGQSQELHEIRRRAVGVRFEPLPDAGNDLCEDIFRLKKTGVPDHQNLASGKERRRDERFAERPDLFAFAVRHEEVEFAVPGIGDQRRRDPVGGVPEPELLLPVEQVARDGLPPLQLGKDRIERRAPPCIVILKCHEML